MSIKSGRVQNVEHELNVQLPDDYALFLNQYGDFQYEGLEIYGYTEKYTDINIIPCVIGATKIYRKDYNLDSKFIVISYTGIEDILVILDTISNVVYEVGANGVIKQINKSFSDWFNSIKKKQH